MYSRYIRDMSSEVSDVKNTFSGWDQCMTKAYCKWPVIIGIIVGVVIAASVVWCLIRCICCGAECCCGCLSCFSCCTSCCNSSRRNNGYTQQPQPAVSQFPQYAQYQPAAAPVYRAQQQQQPQYAHFDAPGAGKPFNEDALPAMPSWGQSRTMRQEEVNEMEMGHLHQHQNNQAAQPMLPKSPHAQVQEYPYQANAGAYSGDLGYAAGDQSRQQHQYGYGQQHMQYSPRSQSPGYESQFSSHAVAPPPSYHTSAPSAVGVARKPIGGSWRDL
ncbi:hypothetical protein E4T39_06247 [Aureobasidium subglaciale]|nr:hypothetical protein E4T39_06247 [Aureobasidium subglaciale]